MMEISNINIDQLKKYCMFHCTWIRFYDMNWKEKINFRNKMFNKTEMWMKKSLLKLVIIYGKNEILDEFLI